MSKFRLKSNIPGEEVADEEVDEDEGKEEDEPAEEDGEVDCLRPLFCKLLSKASGSIGICRLFMFGFAWPKPLFKVFIR